MSTEIGDEGFDERWRAIESPYRRRIAGLAYAGRTSDDPSEAWLVLGFARRRLHPAELIWVTAVAVVAYSSVAQVFFGGPEALVNALLIGILATGFLIRRGRLEAAIAKSEEAIRNAPPPIVPEGDEAGDEERGPEA